MSVGTDYLLTVPVSGPFTITAASSDGIDFARNDKWKASDPALAGWGPLPLLRLQGRHDHSLPER